MTEKKLLDLDETRGLLQQEPAEVVSKEITSLHGFLLVLGRMAANDLQHSASVVFLNLPLRSVLLISILLMATTGWLDYRCFLANVTIALFLMEVINIDATSEVENSVPKSFTP